jgi:hypothetical protein
VKRRTGWHLRGLDCHPNGGLKKYPKEGAHRNGRGAEIRYKDSKIGKEYRWKANAKHREKVGPFASLYGSINILLWSHPVLVS